MEAVHDVARWGPLRAKTAGRERLARLADVVIYLCARDELAQAVAAKRVLDSLPASGLFLLSPVDDATPMTKGTAGWIPRHPRRELAVSLACKVGVSEEAADAAWGALPSALRWVDLLSLQQNIAGALTWAWCCWVDGADSQTDLNEGFGGRLAMLSSDASALFGYGQQGSASAIVQTHAVPPVDRVVGLHRAPSREEEGDVAGGKADTPASSSEQRRARMREYRDQGISDAEIARREGVSRTRVQQLIGTRTGDKVKAADRMHGRRR